MVDLTHELVPPRATSFITLGTHSTVLTQTRSVKRTFFPYQDMQVVKMLLFHIYNAVSFARQHAVGGFTCCHVCTDVYCLKLQ